MQEIKVGFPVILIVSAAIVGAGVSAALAGLLRVESASPIRLETPKSTAGELAGAVVFDPPKPEDAPKELRDAVMLGYHIIKDTQTYAKDYVGNDLNCTNCHFEAGRARHTLSLVGVAVKYPKYRSRHHYSSDLVTRTNGCMKRSQNGKPLPPDSKEMQGIMAYYHWISKGLPIYAEIPWLGLEPIEGAKNASIEKGKEVYEAHCSGCHGPQGQGTRIAPPLWGPGSYNDGAGMSHPDKLAGFAHLYMPKGDPNLTVEQAKQAAAYVDSQPRPHFQDKQDPEDVW